ncbi:MAG: ArsR/SmtB family transcription factor [Lysobacterales bacterium]
MQAFDVLADPVRRQILETLSRDQKTSGEIVSVIQSRFGISQSAVSQHLKVLRDHGFAQVAVEGTRRRYALDAAGFEEVNGWMQQFAQLWAPRLDALATEVARGSRLRRGSVKK